MPTYSKVIQEATQTPIVNVITFANMVYNFFAKYDFDLI